MDLIVFKAINGFAARHDGFEDFVRFVALDAEYFFIALLVVLFFARGRWASRNARHGVVAAGFSMALALGIAQVITHIWARPRPFVAHPDVTHLFVAHRVEPGFPSDHATAAFAIAVSIFLRHKKIGVLAIAMATVMSIGRVAIGVHYPGDVLAGAALGSLCALFFFMPVVRRPLHRLADWAAGLYDSVWRRVSPGPHPSFWRTFGPPVRPRQDRRAGPLLP
ncbi:undecaprenyl-diphosphate phosphatase BcrC [soil metagenome]